MTAPAAATTVAGAADTAAAADDATAADVAAAADAAAADIAGTPEPCDAIKDVEWDKLDYGSTIELALECFGYFDEWRNKQFLSLETVGVLLDDVKEGSSDWIKNDYEINKFFFWQGAAKAAEKAGMDDKEAAEELDALTKKISEKEVDSNGNLKKAGKNCAKNVGKKGRMSMKDFQEKILDEFAGKDYKATDMGMGKWGLQN